MINEITEFSAEQIAKIIRQVFVKHVNIKKAEQWARERQLLLTQEPLTAGKFTLLAAAQIYEMFLTDVQFVAQKDPSLTTVEQVLTTKTKALLATFCYRIATFFYYNAPAKESDDLKPISRGLMEWCLSQTGIDIHPAAKIGAKFFIDHGYGIVVGETCEIGERCNLFNGVILGSKNVVKTKNGKRHPTLKNNVTVCAGAKILGDITLGNNVFVSPGAVVLEDIEDNQKVLIINQLQIVKTDTYSYLPSQKFVVYGMVPKFKNTVSILGDGFYNPTVLIKLKNEKELSYAITYWDKNKILVKFKNTTPLEKEIAKTVKVIVYSNSGKVVVLNNLALEKVLTSLTE